MTQAQLGQLLEIPQSTISRCERGELELDRDKLAVIRDEARRRDLPWDDSWFFDAPAEAAE